MFHFKGFLTFSMAPNICLSSSKNGSFQSHNLLLNPQSGYNKIEQLFQAKYTVTWVLMAHFCTPLFTVHAPLFLTPKKRKVGKVTLQSHLTKRQLSQILHLTFSCCTSKWNIKCSKNTLKENLKRFLCLTQTHQKID